MQLHWHECVLQFVSDSRVSSADWARSVRVTFGVITFDRHCVTSSIKSLDLFPGDNHR